MVTSAEWRDSAKIAELLKSAASIADAGTEFGDALRAALDLVCSFTGWPLGHVYLSEGATAQRSARRLLPTSIWHTDDLDRYANFVAITESTPLAQGTGLPGRILATGEPAWILDVRGDPNFPRSAAAAACGICAGFGFPVVSSRGVESVLEFFSPDAAEPDAVLLDLLAHVGRQLGNVLDMKRAQGTIEESEARLAEAQRLANMGWWRYNVDADQIEWSDELRSMYGFGPTTTPGTFDEYLALVENEYREGVREAIVRTIETHAPFEHEYRFRPPTGEVRWAHARGEVVPGTVRGQLELAGYCQDISHWKATEEELSLGRIQLVEAQRLAKMGSWMWSVADNQVTWSDQLFRIYGLDPGTIPDGFETYLGYVHPDDRERVESSVRRTLETQEPFEHDYRIVRPSGAVRHVHARGEVLEVQDGVPTRLSGYCQDVTARLETEEKLRAIEAMKNSLFAAVSHEMRTPLTVIRGVTRTLENPSVRSSDEVDDLLGSLGRNARRLEDSISDLLDVDRLSRGVVVPRPRPMRLDELMTNVLATFSTSRPILVDVEAVEATLDPGIVERIVESLVSNALRHTPPESPIWVDARPTPEGILIRVDDAGDGVPDDLKAAIFEPFVQGKRIEHSPGTGIGLSLVGRFAELCGGRAWVEDRSGGGASFRVVLPK